jgi:hypothetical protein
MRPPSVLRHHATSGHRWPAYTEWISVKRKENFYLIWKLKLQVCTLFVTWVFAWSQTSNSLSLCRDCALFYLGSYTYSNAIKLESCACPCYYLILRTHVNGGDSVTLQCYRRPKVLLRCITFVQVKCPLPQPETEPAFFTFAFYLSVSLR